MMRFGLLYPEVAGREMRTVSVLEPLPGPDGRLLAVDEYGFDELYCEERGCDCRRVMINVLARDARQHMATINHGFEKPARDAVVADQTFLDPLNQQSPWADALLELFIKVVLADAEYRKRLLRHYRMFKNVVEDRAHPANRLLRLPEEHVAAGRGRAIAPPPRRGKRRRWG
jgi:hypothetical protein